METAGVLYGIFAGIFSPRYVLYPNREAKIGNRRSSQDSIPLLQKNTEEQYQAVSKVLFNSSRHNNGSIQ